MTRLVTAWVAVAPALARGADPEDCLSCHRYRGLARIDEDGRTVRLFHVDPDDHGRRLGPHSHLRCTDCHERSDVEIVPHHPVRPVDCTRACHLAGAGATAVAFAHDDVAGMLESSVHPGDVLEECNRLLGHPLRPGQSRCLLCHDAPAFRRPDELWIDAEAPVARCLVCHDESSFNPRYAYWHVHARSRPARSHRDLTKACALCHSDERVREAFGLSDATASYLLSFHGKAMLLGSEATASCLDCHVGRMQDVHAMRAHRDPESPTYAANLANSCRSDACHATSGQRVSAAAAHLELRPGVQRAETAAATTQPIRVPSHGAGLRAEYFVALFFVLLILVTFGPLVVLLSLEMLQIVLGRRDPDRARRLGLAEKLLADPRSRRVLVRFTPHQRVQHWILVACFTTLAITGFPITFADSAWAQRVVAAMGGLSFTRHLHRWAGAALMLGFFYHVGYIAWSAARQKRTTGKRWAHVILDLPMGMRWEDWKRLWRLLGYLLFLRGSRLPGGRFSFREKFEYFGVFWGCALLGVTGALMWAHPWTTRYLTGRALTIAFLIHTFEAFLALLCVGVIHMISVIFAPSVFPMSRAMWSGDTPAEKLAKAHPALLAEAAEVIADPADQKD